MGQIDFTPPPLSSSKILRRWLLRLVLVGVGIATGVMVRPSLIEDPIKRAQVEQLRNQVLEANTQSQEKALQVLGQTAQTSQQVIEKVTRITQEVTHQNPQQVVNTTITNITNEVKNLPQEQVKKVKLQFCQDVMQELNQQ